MRFTIYGIDSSDPEREWPEVLGSPRDAPDAHRAVLEYAQQRVKYLATQPRATFRNLVAVVDAQEASISFFRVTPPGAIHVEQITAPANGGTQAGPSFPVVEYEAFPCP